MSTFGTRRRQRRDSLRDVIREAGGGDEGKRTVIVVIIPLSCDEAGVRIPMSK